MFGLLYLVMHLKTKGGRQKWLECTRENVLNDIFACYNFIWLTFIDLKLRQVEVLQHLLLS